MTLLDFIRYHKDLSGTKIGCREGDCGACTVLVGTLQDDGSMTYLNITSCLTPVGNVLNKHVVTIEGINLEEGLTPTQRFMVDEGGTQCGFCTVGFIVSLTGYSLGYHQQKGGVLESIDGNICRCTGYKSIERAANKLEDALSQLNTSDWITQLVNSQFIPPYFISIPDRMRNLKMVYLANESGRAISGGTDLYVQQHDTLVEIDLRHLTYLNKNYIREEDGVIHVGANVTATTFCDSPIILQYLPGMSEFKKLIASAPIRNISSLVGNLVNASPIADFANILLAIDAHIKTSSGRSISLDQFYTGYKTFDLQPEEVIHELYFQLNKWTHFNFEKVSKRTQLDIASVNSSIALIFEDGNPQSKIILARISAGGVFAYPLYLSKTSSYLEGKILNRDTIHAALGMAASEISPISDVRGSDAYKSLLLRQLLLTHIHILCPHLDDVILEVIQ